MKWFKIVFVIPVVLICLWSPFQAWSQDDDSLDIGDEIEAAEEEEITLDEEEPAPAADTAEAPPATTEPEKTEEMTLEPLQGDEDQVTEAPPEAPASEPTPLELTPEPPSVADESQPTPEATPEPMALVSDDSPDLAYEAKIHDIYLNYNSKKMTDEEWSQLLGSRESESYQIQPGDTLWSISKTFFNDGNYWPKIWQLNSVITNPHLIQPGNSIRFLLGTESETPAFAVTEGGQEPVEMPVGEAGAAELDESGRPKLADGKMSGSPTDEVEIPPPSEEYRPVLKKVPPSLPEWSWQRRGDSYDDSGVDYGRRRILDLPDKKYLESYIEDGNVVAEGEVAEIEGGASTAANFQYIFLKLPSGQAKPGDLYTVIRKSGQLPRISEEVAVAEREMGYQYQIQGQVRLEDLLSTASDGRDIFRAFVVKSLGQINLGSLVIKGSLPTLSLNPNGEKANIMTQIIGAHQIDGQKTLSLHSLAFLSGGHAAGLKEGQILTVRANTRVRNANSIIKESYIPVGLLRVVKVGDKFSTAIVLKVWDAIFVGDVTGDGKVVPPEPPERRRATKTTAKAAPATTDGSDIQEEDFEMMDESTDGATDGTEEFEELEE